MIELLKFFEISTATNHALKLEISFLVHNKTGVDEFIAEYMRIVSLEANRKTSKGLILLKVLNHLRQRLLDRTRYTSRAEFIANYLANPYEALERLFGEYMDDMKIRHVETATAEAIYDTFMLHRTDPRNKWEKVSPFDATFMQIAARLEV